jgi:hypothetical protein
MDPSGRTIPNGVDVKAVVRQLRSSKHTAKQRTSLCKKVMTLKIFGNEWSMMQEPRNESVLLSLLTIAQPNRPLVRIQARAGTSSDVSLV